MGDLNKVTRIVKLMSLVNSTLEFTEAHLVTNGASELFGEVFGVTAVICLVGAGFAAFVAGGRHESEQSPTEDDEALVPSR